MTSNQITLMQTMPESPGYIYWNKIEYTKMETYKKTKGTWNLVVPLMDEAGGLQENSGWCEEVDWCSVRMSWIQGHLWLVRMASGNQKSA